MSRPCNSARGEGVSAVLPVYNGARFVAEAVESVYAQTVPPGEVIVVDDGSTDDTALVLERFGGRPGFQLVHKQNGGEASARNAGVERANGEYIAFIDHDDLWRPQKLERQLAQFHPTWGMSFTAYERTTAKASELVAHKTWDPDPGVVISLLERSAALRTPSTWLIRRVALQRIGPFEHVSPFGTDWLMGLRFAAAGNQIGYLGEALTEYRIHDTNLSSDQHGEFLDCACGVSDRYGDPRVRAWWRVNTAIYAHGHHDRQRARRRISEAARIRPQSIRPGWVRLLF